MATTVGFGNKLGGVHFMIRFTKYPKHYVTFQIGKILIRNRTRPRNFIYFLVI